MKKLLCFWICLCLGFLGEVQAQAIWAKDFPFAGGLPTNEMTTVYQDGDGFIWVGTTNGLVRYDGYRVRLFQRDGRLVTGLTDNRITQMAEDSLWLWVGTSAGLNLIHRNTYQVSAFPDESLGKGYINGLCSDGENAVWVGTDNRVLVFRAPSLHPVDTITLASRGGKRAVVNKILRDRTGRLWICTRAGLFLHEPSTNRLCHLPPVGESDNLSSVCQDRDGRLWVASWGEGLWQIVADRNFRDVRYVFHPVESFQKGAGESRFFDVEQDDVCGYLWALSYDRLYAFRITPEGTLEQVELPFYVDAEKMYTRILKDRDGNLWLSSYDRGTLLTFHGETVRDVPLSGFAEALGKRPNLLTLTVDGRGRFWFVQDRFGLCLHDPSDGSTVLASQDVRRVTVDVRVVAESPSEDGAGLADGGDTGWQPLDAVQAKGCLSGAWKKRICHAGQPAFHGHAGGRGRQGVGGYGGKTLFAVAYGRRHPFRAAAGGFSGREGWGDGSFPGSGRGRRDVGFHRYGERVASCEGTGGVYGCEQPFRFAWDGHSESVVREGVSVGCCSRPDFVS